MNLESIDFGWESQDERKCKRGDCQSVHSEHGNHSWVWRLCRFFDKGLIRFASYLQFVIEMCALLLPQRSKVIEGMYRHSIILVSRTLLFILCVIPFSFLSSLPPRRWWWNCTGISICHGIFMLKISGSNSKKYHVHVGGLERDEKKRRRNMQLVAASRTTNNHLPILVLLSN